MIEEQLKQAKLACRKMQNIDKDTKIKALVIILHETILKIQSLWIISLQDYPEKFFHKNTYFKYESTIGNRLKR